MGIYNTQINLKIGDSSWVADSEHVMQLNHTRLVSNTGSVVIEIYDDTALEVELALLASNDKTVQFWYGNPGEKTSRIYTALITKITPAFQSVGVMLTLEGTPLSDYKSRSSKCVMYQGTPTQIVKKIGEEQDWDFEYLVETKEFPEGFQAIRDEGESATHFIVNKIIPYAETLDGRGNFQFVLEEIDGKKVASFFNAGAKTSNEKYIYTIGNVSEEVIEFTPQYGDFLYSMLGSGGTVSNALDPTSNESSETRAKSSEDIPKDNSLLRISSMSKEQLTTLNKNLTEVLRTSVYSATLVLRGRPDIEVGSNIKITVLTRDGYEHFSSGVYMIQSAEELIDGAYTTTLNLLRLRDGEVTTEVSSNSNIEVKVSSENIESVLTFGYCRCEFCNGTKKVTTSSGNIPVQGKTIAADWNVYKKGTKIKIGNTVYTVEDKNPKSIGKAIGIYFDRHIDVINYQFKQRDISVLREEVVSAQEVLIPCNVPESKYLEACKKYLGLPYGWGEEGPYSYDCSGFVWSLMKDLGYNWYRDTAENQSKRGIEIPISGTLGIDYAREGDLLFEWVHSRGKIGHVMCYLGNGYVVHAPDIGKFICIERVTQKPYCIRRLM